ncbi:MAG: asparagine synthase (glutamine-hydrolyzing) [Sphingobacteriaceae bacterium]
MCGIVGYISNQKIDIVPNLDAIKHRGPDATNHYFYEDSKLNVCLGHVRLSIIDLSDAANQPFKYANNKCSIVFNGEIYNYRELKEELIAKGYKFHTSSDTEVLLCMYLEHGMGMLDMLNGIFSFCILDEDRNRLFIVRDHLGIKPLYYFTNENSFFFASEIKALILFPGVKKVIDPKAITEFLLNGFIYEPETGFKDIHKVAPGTYVELELRGENFTLDKITYWKPGGKENIRSVEKVIKESIRSQTVSDVPIGLFFSGGIDSSIILSELRGEIQSFVIQADDKEYIEAGMTSDYTYAVKIAALFNSKLESIKISNSESLTGEELLKYIIFLSKATEEPIADFTFISSQLLSRETKKLGYTVMLSGMGADEIFAGYPRYRMIMYESIYKKLRFFINTFLKKWKFFKKKIERFNSFLDETDFIFRYSSLIGVFSKKEVGNMLKSPSFNEYHKKLKSLLVGYDGISDVKKAILLDYHGFLSHNFTVADKSSMLESVELRVPLATKELYEIGFNLPDVELMSFFRGKLPLRKMLCKDLPSSLVNRRKAGFNPPMDNAINDLGNVRIYSFMSDSNLFNTVNSEFVIRLLSDHFSGKINNTYKIFSLLYLSSWLKINE